MGTGAVAAGQEASLSASAAAGEQAPTRATGAAAAGREAGLENMPATGAATEGDNPKSKVAAGAL
jgi:hypothetical protein